MLSDRPGGISARTRLGVTTPPTLAELKPGEIAISAPIFIQPTELADLPAADPLLALSRMYGLVTFKRPEALGIYWETYGVQPSDTVTMSIGVRRDPGGLLSRLIRAVGLSERNTESVIGWTEESPRQTITIGDGPVPIHGRLLTLSVAQLRSGHYLLSTSIARPGQPAVSQSREFWIVE
jgi:hypothetical protein